MHKLGLVSLRQSLPQMLSSPKQSALKTLMPPFSSSYCRHLAKKVRKGNDCTVSEEILFAFAAKDAVIIHVL